MAERTLWFKHDPNYENDCHEIFMSLKKKLYIDHELTIIWYTLRSHNRSVTNSIKAEVFPDEGKIIFHLNHIYEKGQTLEKNRLNFLWTALHELIHLQRGFDTVDNEHAVAFDMCISIARELDIDYQTLFKIINWHIASSYLIDLTGVPRLMWDIFIYKKKFNILSRYYDLGLNVQNHAKNKKVLINEDLILSMKRMFDKLDPSMNLLLSAIEGFGWYNQYKRDAYGKECWIN